MIKEDIDLPESLFGLPDMGVWKQLHTVNVDENYKLFYSSTTAERVASTDVAYSSLVERGFLK